jgi:DNA-binding ferritin-like protein
MAPTRKRSTNGDIVSSLLTIRNQIKVYHWQTKSFSRHKGTDELVTKLDEGIDEFVETYMGKYGRPKVTKSIVLHNFSESAARNFVAQQRTYLSNILPRKISPQDTDLLNIRDTILGNLNQTLYMFSLA